MPQDPQVEDGFPILRGTERFAYLVSGSFTDDGRVRTRVGRTRPLIDYFEQGSRVARRLNPEPVVVVPGRYTSDDLDRIVR